MWRSPLHDELAAAGAVFERFGDLELAARFGSETLPEYRAVRTAVGVLDLSHRRKLRVTGADRVTFLQGMLSNDVLGLSPGQGCHATFLNVQGRVIADLRAYVLETEIVLDAWPAAADGLITGLEKHLVADEVEIEEVTADVATLSVQGPWADKAVDTLTGTNVRFERELDHAEVTAAGETVRLARVREAGELGYEIFAPASAARTVWRALLAQGEPLGLHAVGQNAFDVLRVEAGIPWYGVDMDPSRIVVEVGLEDAISTTKGCYLGQEVVERVGARGHVNRMLTGLRISGDVVPPAGSVLEVDGKEVGVVTSAVDSPAIGRPIAMAYVRREHLAPSSPVSIRTPGGLLAAEVTSLPFYGG